MRYYKLINKSGWGDSFILNKIYPENFKSDEGFKSNVSDYAHDWPQDWKKVTEEEYNIQEGITKEFKLPESWYIRTNPEIEPTLIKFRGGTYSGKKEESVLTNEPCWYYISQVKDTHTEITFDQFKQYVIGNFEENLLPLPGLI